MERKNGATGRKWHIMGMDTVEFWRRTEAWVVVGHMLEEWRLCERFDVIGFRDQ